jgi:hypothetical protein
VKYADDLVILPKGRDAAALQERREDEGKDVNSY